MVAIPELEPPDDSVVAEPARFHHEDPYSDLFADEGSALQNEPNNEDGYDGYESFENDAAADEYGEYQFGSERKRKTKRKRSEATSETAPEPTSGRLSLETVAIVGGSFLLGLVISLGSLWLFSGSHSTATGGDSINAGYGDDLNAAIQLAIADLEARKYSDFVEKIVPDSARVAVLADNTGEGILSQLSPDSPLVVLMLADLKALQTLQPKIQGNTASYQLPPMTASGGFPVPISSPQARSPEDREIRFSLIGGSWKFFDNLAGESNL